MKRRMNKRLSLLVAVLMLFSSIGINAVAVVEHKCTINPDNPAYCNVVNPTCDTQGYTEYLCTICKKVVSEGDYKNPLGHQFKDVCYDELNADGSAYYKYSKCVRKYVINGKEVEGCDARTYEIDDNGNRTLYKLVTFKNNKVTASYNESILYTNVAAEFTTKTLYSTYVKVGDTISYEGSSGPYREKTVHYGEYKCIGWSTSDNLEAKPNKNLSGENCLNLETLTSTFKDGHDIVLYPVFQGVNVRYDVVFFDFDVYPLTNSQKVNHGEFAKYSDPDGIPYAAPPKAEDLKNYYQFNGWSPLINQTQGITIDEIESIPVYGDINYYPTYKPVAKNFVIEFYDEKGTTILETADGKKAVFEGIHLEENFFAHKGDIYEELLKFSLVSIDKDSDSEYRYAWAGWQVLCGDDSAGSKIVTVDKYGDVVFHGFDKIASSDVINVVDEDGKTVYLDEPLPKGLVAKGEPDLEPKKVIRLVPVFTRTLQTYVVDIEMDLPDGEDTAYYKGEADVHVVDRDNQLAASGFTDAYGKFRCRLAYRNPFTVTVATYDGKYVGTATISDLYKISGGDDAEGNINKCLVKMELNPEYEKHCGCIHHNSLLQPIIVRIFNILYSFFNVKYVCCYDMYSTIGPLLDYTK